MKQNGLPAVSHKNKTHNGYTHKHAQTRTYKLFFFFFFRETKGGRLRERGGETEAERERQTD